MTVRPATFTDIPGIVLLLQDGFLRSHYAKDGRTQIDVPETKRQIVHALHRHGGTHGGATWVSVAERNGGIEGLVVGQLVRVYGIGSKLTATDAFFVASERVDPADPLKLMKSMVEWARGCPDVIEIKCGATSVILDDPERAGVILERLGMKKYGRIWRMEV